MMPNGDDWGARLTRLEKFMEEFSQAVANDHKQLLTAQVLLTDRLDRFIEESRKNNAHLKDRLDETTDKLNGLIDVVNRHINEYHHPPPGKQQ